jgi:hypothetical protein
MNSSSPNFSENSEGENCSLSFNGSPHAECHPRPRGAKNLQGPSELDEAAKRGYSGSLWAACLDFSILANAEYVNLLGKVEFYWMYKRLQGSKVWTF